MKYKKSVYNTFLLISQLGISILVPIFLCIVAGTLLEKKFHITLTVPFIILGVLAGVRNAYVLLRKALEDMEDEMEED